MDHKQFPGQEGDFVSEEWNEVPSGLPETGEEAPIVEEPLVFEDAPAAEKPVAEEIPAIEEEPITEEFPVEEDISATEEASADKGVSFMERIPNVDEDYPEEPAPADELAHELLTDPEMGSEITPDENAMDHHGMLGHGEEEPPFDLSILDDPEFSEVPAAPEQPEEEINDQEYRDNGKDFDAIFNAPAAEEEIPTHQRPTRKGRPKRKKGEGLLGIPNILVTFVWLALILAIGVTLGRMLWVCAADVLAFGREDKIVTVTIYEADTMEDITEKLYDAGLIRYKSLFNLYASLAIDEGEIQPGIYDLNTLYDYHALTNMMSPRSTREVVEGLLIPEGYTCRQIFDLLEENRVCTAVDLAAYAANGELGDYWFLENVERGSENCLEGFLFPDTYDFYKNSTPKEVLTKLLDNFEYRFSDEMRAQIDTLNANVTGGTFTVREVTIVASLIEKETANSDESPKIASVIYNRLFNWDYPALLNIDAAIIYAQNGDTSTIDTSLDSPYNTYLNTGLTPTPIANPGLSSLQAALNPTATNYYYYVLNPATGTHQFSTTYEEHEQWRAQFAAAAAAEGE